jgi:hypothetical protein
LEVRGIGKYRVGGVYPLVDFQLAENSAVSVKNLAFYFESQSCITWNSATWRGVCGVIPYMTFSGYQKSIYKNYYTNRGQGGWRHYKCLLGHSEGWGENEELGTFAFEISADKIRDHPPSVKS